MFQERAQIDGNKRLRLKKVMSSKGQSKTQLGVLGLEKEILNICPIQITAPTASAIKKAELAFSGSQAPHSLCP